MRPVSPVMPGFSEPYEFVLAANQPEYEPLPCVLLEGDDKGMISRWEFSDSEREVIAEGGSLLLNQLTFGQLFQPVSLRIVGKDQYYVRKMDEAAS